MPSPEIVAKLGPEWLRTAAHEAGHAVIAAVQGIPVDHARVWYVGSGQSTYVRGVMHPGRERRGAGLVGSQRADAELVMALAGPAAEVAWLRHAERMRAGAAEHTTEHMWDGDIHNARKALRAGATLTLSQGRAQARMLVRAHWRGIERTAAQLARRGYIAGPSVRVS